MSYRDSDNFDVAAERDYVEACDYFDSLRGQEVSEYDDEPDYYGHEDDEPNDFRDDVEADADTLASAGYGTDEDYGYYGEACDNGWD